MKRRILNSVVRLTTCVAGCVLLSVVFGACSRPESKVPDSTATASDETTKIPQDEGAPPDVVLTITQLVDLKAGSTADALVTVKIKPGYHINGNPSSKYQIATTLDVETNDGVTGGKTTYPPSVIKKFSFSPDPIMVYENDVVIKQPLLADAGATKGTRTQRARLRVQPCNDTVCFPPRNVDVSIPVNVN